jgi:hypothetical protein
MNLTLFLIVLALPFIVALQCFFIAVIAAKRLAFFDNQRFKQYAFWATFVLPYFATTFYLIW